MQDPTPWPHAMMWDFADAAAVVAQLDLIIMTDSAVGHLAGAVGTPVWVMLNRSSHWMWGAERIDGLWYSCAKYLSARSWNNWTEVFDEISIKIILNN